MTAPEPLPAELTAVLLAHDQWLRSLARSLVHGSDVDDLVQETWLAAATRRPATDRPLRNWLATVLRRLAARHRRGTARRRARELALRPGNDFPSTAATVALLELQSKVSAAVAEMPEPYRSVLLLRFFHGLSYAAIALRTGLREEAARKRSERALELLRARLQQADAEWRGSLAMAALAGPKALPILHALSGFLLMNNTIKVTAAALLLALVGGMGCWFALPTNIAPQAGLQIPVTPVVAAGSGQATTPSPASDRQPSGEDNRVLVATPAANRQRNYAGRILDKDGRPLAGVPIVLATNTTDSDRATLPIVARSAPNGSFGFAAESYASLLAGPGWATLRASPLGSWSGREPLLVVAAPAVQISGVVVDEAGAPLANVDIHPQQPTLITFPEPLDATTAVPARIFHCATDGGFHVDNLPAGLGAIEFRCRGHASVHIDVPRTDAADLRVVMLPGAAVDRQVIGTVLDPRDLPVDQATVGLGEIVVQTDANGRFELPSRPVDDLAANHAILFAAKAGFQTLVIADAAAQLAADGERELVLHLPGPSLSIRGRAVDADGKPLAGALVYPWNEIPVLHQCIAEELGMAADAPMQQIGNMQTRVVTTTAEDGTFELGGLRAREYRLHVLLRQPRAGFTSEAIAAGSRLVELRAPARLTYDVVAGCVVTRRGQPVADVRVSASLAVYRVGGDVYGDSLTSLMTDASGRFELHDMPVSDLTMYYSGPDILPGSAAMQAMLPLREQRIVVTELRHLRLQVDPKATAFRVLDAAGNRLSIYELAPGYSSGLWQRPLQRGRSAVLAVAEDAAMVVLLAGDDEVVRLPLRLRASEVSVVRY